MEKGSSMNPPLMWNRSSRKAFRGRWRPSSDQFRLPADAQFRPDWFLSALDQPVSSHMFAHLVPQLFPPSKNRFLPSNYCPSHDYSIVVFFPLCFFLRLNFLFFL